mgnify:CR=1 FL=1
MVGPAGPRISTGFSDGGPFGGDRGRVPTDPAAAARNVFSRYDRDNDGKLTDAEFPQDLRTRRAMTEAGITLEFPAGREDFEKAYIKYIDQTRPRQYLARFAQ